MTEAIVGQPGVQSAQERTFTDRKIRKTVDNRAYLIGGKSIDGSLSRDTLNAGDVDILRPGFLMGIVTASKKFAASIIGTIINAEIATSVAIEVSVDVAKEIVRRFGATGTFNLTGPPAAAGVVITEIVTYTGVDVVTGIITVNATTAAFIAGSFIQPEDGSEDFSVLIDDNEFMRVTDRDRNDIDVDFPLPLLAGQIDSSQIIFWPSDTSLRTFIVAGLNTAGRGDFLFDHFFD